MTLVPILRVSAEHRKSATFGTVLESCREKIGIHLLPHLNLQGPDKTIKVEKYVIIHTVFLFTYTITA